MARTSRQCLIQMSGAPGAGKSTIAAELCRRYGMVSLDHDVVKSALLETGSFADSGPASYEVLIALAEDLLGQGHSVVIDSPCWYDELLASGQSLGARVGVPYLYLECRTDDLDVLDARLRGRVARPSQRTSVTASPTDDDRPDSERRDQFRAWIAGMKRPEADSLVIDTSRDVDDCLGDVEDFLRARGVGS
ncbi:MAG: ATP-binding protein [Nocardioides sp.]